MLIAKTPTIVPELAARDARYSAGQKQPFKPPYFDRRGSSLSVPVLEGLVLTTDIALLVGATMLLARWEADATTVAHQHLLAMLVAVAITIFLLARGGAYRLQQLRSAAAQVQVIGAAVVLGCAAGALSAHLLRPEDPIYGPLALGRWLLTALLLLALSRLVLQRVIRGRTADPVGGRGRRSRTGPQLRAPRRCAL